MKPIYTIFSQMLFLNSIALLMFCFTLQMSYYFVMNFVFSGWNYYFVDGNFIGLIAYFLLLVFDIWILTATILPIIRIDDFGIKAYSIFWTRFLKWEEINSIHLLKASTQSSRNFMHVSWRKTNIPVRTSTFRNKGVRVNTFVVLFKTKFKMPPDLSIRGLLSHGKIVDNEAIAFEFDIKSWSFIQEKINNKSVHTVSDHGKQ